MSPPPAQPEASVHALDRALPVAWRAVLFLLCAFVPTSYIAMQYAHRSDLTGILSFGQKFQARELPEIRAMKPDIVPGPGFDGQFYAQIAIDPTFRRPDLRPALDNSGLRGQRIFLPTLAHLLGAGRPRTIVFAYALLNLAFWYGLFAALAWRLPATSLRAFLALFAIMLSTAALISVESALTDLPAVTLGVLALGATEIPAAAFITVAILTKPTCGLFLLRYLAPFPLTAAAWAKKGALALLALALPVCWQLYLWQQLRGSRAVDESLFSFPFVGCWHQLIADIGTLMESRLPANATQLAPWGWQAFEILALISLAVQACFLLFRPQPREAIWLIGVGFIGLLVCLSDKSYESQVSYTRTIFPVTIAFNLLLAKVQSRRAFFALFLGGNVGFLGGLCEMLMRTWG